MPEIEAKIMSRLDAIEQGLATIRRNNDAAVAVLRDVIEDATFLYERPEILGRALLARKVEHIRERAEYALSKLAEEP